MTPSQAGCPGCRSSGQTPPRPARRWPPARPRRRSHDADLSGVQFPLLGVRAHQFEGLQGVVHPVGPGLVAVAAEAIAQDDRADAVIGEERHKGGGFADVQRAVSAPAREDDGRSGVQLAIAGVKLDRGIVDVRDGSDLPGTPHAVNLGLADILRLEIRRIGGKERDHHAARQYALRGVGRVGLRTGRRYALGCGQGSQRSLSGGKGINE